jgi:hypothetical protein
MGAAQSGLAEPPKGGLAAHFDHGTLSYFASRLTRLRKQVVTAIEDRAKDAPPINRRPLIYDSYRLRTVKLSASHTPGNVKLWESPRQSRGFTYE